jgi:hypothetical protein
MDQLGKMLIVIGVIVAALGLVLMLGPRFGLGRLPLDFRYHRDNFSVYFPLGTSILLSVVLTLIFSLLHRR